MCVYIYYIFDIYVINNFVIYTFVKHICFIYIYMDTRSFIHTYSALWKIMTNAIGLLTCLLRGPLILSQGNWGSRVMHTFSLVHLIYTVPSCLRLKYLKRR